MLDTAFAVPHGAFYAARQRAAYFLGAGPREKLYSLRRFAARHAPRPVLDTYATMVSLALRYAPRPYDGHVIYFLADRPMDRLARSKWASLAPGMEFCTVPGNHAECLSEPLLGAFGATLRGCLDKADAPMAASVGEARSPA